VIRTHGGKGRGERPTTRGEVFLGGKRKGGEEEKVAFDLVQEKIRSGLVAGKEITAFWRNEKRG